MIYKMIQSQQSLEWICETIMNGKKIQTSRLISAKSNLNAMSKKTISPSPRMVDSKPSPRVFESHVNNSNQSPYMGSQELQLVRKEVEEDSPIRDVMRSPRRSYSKQKKGISPNRFTKVGSHTPIKVMRDSSQLGLRSRGNLTTRSSTK